MKQALALFAVAILTFTLNDQAHALGDVTNCQVKAVKDGGDYENEYDFEFTDYKWIVLDLSKPNDKSVIIGAMTYSEQDAILPSAIRLVQAYGSASVEIAPLESDERFYIRIDSRQGTGEFKRLVEGAWVSVAELTCAP